MALRARLYLACFVLQFLHLTGRYWVLIRPSQCSSLSHGLYPGNSVEKGTLC